MCHLAFIPEYADFNKLAMEHILNAGFSNDDGHGWAIADPNYNEVLTGHSLSIEDALEDFLEAREVFTGPALFHSRWATHGSIRLENCHPFTVNHSTATVLGHNGILPKEAYPKVGDDRSDTRILADELMPKWYSKLDNRRTRQSLSRWIGPGNKLVILTVDPKYKKNSYLINENSGMWDTSTGIWHSNSDHQSRFGRWGSYLGEGVDHQWDSPKKNSTGWETAGKGYVEQWPSTVGGSCATSRSAKDSADVFKRGYFKTEYDDDGNELCVFCDGKVNDRTFYCDSCGSCADCYEHLSDCLCMAPSKALATKSQWDWD